MGNVIEVDFKDTESFRLEMDGIIDDFVVCLTKHYGEEAGFLMAKSFTISLEDIAERVTKQLAVMRQEPEPDVLFTPENHIDILFTPEFKLS